MVIRSRHNDDPAKVTYAYLEREVTSLAEREKNKTNKVAAEISQDSEDPIASVATFYTASVATYYKFTLRKGVFNHAERLTRVNRARPYQRQLMENTESPN
jgi:hypothetical protein